MRTETAFFMLQMFLQNGCKCTLKLKVDILNNYYSSGCHPFTEFRLCKIMFNHKWNLLLQ